MVGVPAAATQCAATYGCHKHAAMQHAVRHSDPLFVALFWLTSALYREKLQEEFSQAQKLRQLASTLYGTVHIVRW